MASNQSFFIAKSNSGSLPIKSPGMVSFSGVGELACAALIVDLFLAPIPTKRLDELAETLLQGLFKYNPTFPGLQHNPEFLMPAKYLQALCVEQRAKPQALCAFIEALAFSLKHTLLYHLLNHSIHYPTLFLDSTQGAYSWSSLMQNPLTLNPWIAHALSRALQLTVHQYTTKDHKLLPKHQVWSNKFTLNTHYLCLHHEFMGAHLEYATWFEPLKTIKPSARELSPETKQDMTLRAQSSARQMKEYQTHILNTYHATLENLSKLVQKNKLTLDELETHFVHSKMHSSIDESVLLKKEIAWASALTDSHEHMLLASLARKITLGQVADIIPRVTSQHAHQSLSFGN